MDKDERRLGDSELMLMTRRIADNVNTYHQRGLRIWLVPATDDAPHTKKLNHCDIIPDKSDTIKSLVDKVNRKIEDFQLKGKIVSIQTLWVYIKENKIESEMVKWTESSTCNSNRAFILRVLYSEEDCAKEVVVLKDILPQATSDGGYEDFESMLTSANSWLKQQTDITSINMQSILIQKQHDSTEEPGNTCFFTIPGLENNDSTPPLELFRMVRIIYCRTKPGKLGGIDGNRLCPLTFETFTPLWISIHEGKASSKRERVEKMKEVFKRADDFLDASGCDIVNAETVMNPMQVPSDDDNSQEIKWLFTLRLYLTNQNSTLKLEEPNFRRSSIKRGSFRSSSRRKKKGEDEENVHPGPIFLRNVVLREFKYRWVIVGVVAFVTMSIIVALSVVYANKT